MNSTRNHGDNRVGCTLQALEAPGMNLLYWSLRGNMPESEGDMLGTFQLASTG